MYLKLHVAVVTFIVTFAERQYYIWCITLKFFSLTFSNYVSPGTVIALLLISQTNAFSLLI